MDFWYYFLGLFWIGILLSPFILFFKNSQKSPFVNQRESELRSRRQNHMETLRELKLDWDTGKFSKDEFESMANPIIQELQEIDNSLSSKL